MQIESYQQKDLPAVAEKLIDFCENVPVWCFDAEMGAGKTTLIKEIGKQLGVVGEMSSPTFPIVNEYELENGDTLYHFDCYRLEELEEAISIGVEDYLFSGNLCLIEWYGIIFDVLPSHYAKINIKFVEEGKRFIKAEII